MCHRFATLTIAQVREVLASLKRATPLRPLLAADDERAEAFPGTDVALIATEDGSGMQATQLSWGFDLPAKRKLVFNTRIERAAYSSFWQDSYLHRRCVVPALSFCETHRSMLADDGRGKRVRQVYRFSLNGGAPLLMGGIWCEDRFSILTTEPSPALAAVHDRMPLLLDESAALSWLEGADICKASPLELASAPVYAGGPARGQLGLF